MITPSPLQPRLAQGHSRFSVRNILESRTMTRISTGQRKILDRFLPGRKLELDALTGRYAFFYQETVTHVDQRPIEAMLRSGLLTKDCMGRCYPAPVPQAKNCHACQHLEHFDDTDTDGNPGPAAGWGCNKRGNASERQEAALIHNLTRESYRNRQKRCHEPKLIEDAVRDNAVKPPLFAADPTNIMY
jgi:hypothetical protein